MEFKDWILLLVPLLGNGVIFFVLQQMFVSRHTRKIEKRNYRDKVIERFMSHLEEFLTAFHKVRQAYEDPTDMVPLSIVWNPTSELMQNLNIYYDKHQVVLNKLSPTMLQIDAQWNSMVDFIAMYKLSNRGMDSEFINNFNSQCHTLHQLIQQCMSECENQFLKT